jgi:hypothetical protein
MKVFPALHVANDVVIVHFVVEPIQVVSPNIVLSACVRPVCTEKIKALNLQTMSCLDPVAFNNRMPKSLSCKNILVYSRFARFCLVQHTTMGKTYQITTSNTKGP